MSDATNRCWQSGRSQNQCHRYMLENEVASDITIKFPESGSVGKELAVHKYILICRSPVFEAMLTGNFQESTGHTVRIVDIDPDIFMELLKYAYLLTFL